MRLHSSGNRRGFALLVALAALVIIGGLIVGAFFASTQEYRIGRNTVLQSRAMTAAEYGLNDALRGGNWNSDWANAAAGEVVLPNTPFTPGDGSSGQLQVVSLGKANFLVVSEGFSGNTLGAQGRKRLGGFVKLRTPNINFMGAVTTRSSIMVNGSSQIHGEDTTPDGWNPADCPPLDPKGKPGVMMGPSGDASQVKCLKKGCVTGDPPVDTSDVAGLDETYNQFGEISYADLAAMADIQFAPGEAGNSPAPAFDTDKDGNLICDRKQKMNWGDALHNDPSKTVCRPYFPVIHVAGDLHLTGGSGQGILLVDGDLTATGGVNFVGPVIVRGTFSVAGNGSGARFVGGVLAANDIELDDNKMTGNAVVSYSSCAISKALNGSAKPAFDTQRGWIEMY
jgi:type II secretory pathway pseudopilin PulG